MKAKSNKCLSLSTECIHLPQILFPHTTLPSSLHVHTLQSSPAGIVLSPTEYSVPLYIHTEIEWDAIINRRKECNIKVMYKCCVDTSTKSKATLRLYIKYIYLPHILSPQSTLPSSLQVHTLQSSPAGTVVSPTK